MSRAERLTPRRREVLRLMAKGLTNREISQILDISPKTVKSHVEAILRSLDVTNRTEAVGLYGELEDKGAASGSGLSQPFTSRPALAVLPFSGAASSGAPSSGDNAGDHIIDGLVDELIAHLSRLRWIPVISRHSTFTYRRSPQQDIRAFGRELGAAYIVTGLVRREDATRVLVDVELIEAATGQLIWSDRVSGALDRSTVIPEITRSIVGSIDQILKRYIAEQVMERDMVHLDAWDTALRAFAHFYLGTPEDNRRAETLFRASLELRPSVLAYGGLADTYYMALLNQWTDDRNTTIRRIGEAALASLRLDPNADYSHVIQAVHGSLTGNAAGMQASFEAALALNPSSVRSYSSVGKLLALRGDPETGIAHLNEALRLGPREPSIWSQYLGMAMAHFVAGRLEEALVWGRRGLALNPTSTVLHAGMASTYFHLGRLDEARAAAETLRELGPSSARSDFATLLAFAAPDVLAKFAGGLQALGVRP